MTPADDIVDLLAVARAAVMEAKRVSKIFTFSTGFDAYPGRERISS